jgi:hypothetical protein
MSKINASHLYEVLREKGVNNFFHANTVKTAITYIKKGALLSREYVEMNGLFQTPQYTDEKDKRIGIWNSVFLDGTDLHKKFVTRNLYGPISFHISLDILLNKKFSEVRVTKNNPSGWLPTKPNFYETVEDIKNDYLAGNKFRDGGIMFLLDNPEEAISLNAYCTKILIDDPKIVFEFNDGSNKSISEMVKLTIDETLKEANLLSVETEIRHLDKRPCNCYFQYKTMFSKHRTSFDKLFAKQ